MVNLCVTNTEIHDLNPAAGFCQDSTSKAMYQCSNAMYQCSKAMYQCLSIQSTTTCLVCSSPAAFHSPAQHLDFLSRWHQCNKTNII
ncbi:hypothetical protein Ae201684_017149 [Aphanomyces euteiches]|uniref:Uncharacterized protein n=1 Tax=Aphanomyces euteiches TaxID=100861 RepID=A0A6G0WB21_9STRA|nr:hypothetical protein Ae201684_017149 [Aphanomyces euteiches]